jgi:hypothetical protein
VVDIAIEIEMEDMVADRARRIHEKDHTNQTAMKRILANCEDIRCNRTSRGLSRGGFLEYSIFLPFITRGKRFFDALSPR